MEHVDFIREQIDFIREQVDFIREMLLDFRSPQKITDRSSKWHNFSTNDSMIDRLKVFSIANYLENTLVMSISVLLDQGRSYSSSIKSSVFFGISLFLQIYRKRIGISSDLDYNFLKKRIIVWLDLSCG